MFLCTGTNAEKNLIGCNLAKKGDMAAGMWIEEDRRIK